MRRAVVPVIVGCAPLSSPPEIALLGDTVAVEVTSDSRAVTSAHLGLVRNRFEDALRAGNRVATLEEGGAVRVDNLTVVPR